MGTLFRTYEEQFIETTSQLSRDCEELRKARGARRKELVSEIEKNLAEADAQVEQMQMEALGTIGAPGAQLREKVSQFDSKVKQLRKTYNANKLEASKGDLLGSVSSNSGTESGGVIMRAGADEWSERLQKQRQRYSDQDDMIDSSMRDVEQASKQGTETLQELGQQKERIHGFVERLDEIDDDHTQSVGILGRIARRMRTTKCIMWLIIIAVLGIIFLILYFKVFK